MLRKPPTSKEADPPAKEELAGRAGVPEWTPVENMVRSTPLPASPLPTVGIRGLDGLPARSLCAHVRRRRFQAAFLAVVGANETLQSQSTAQREELANKRYPELLRDITSMVGGVVRWDGKGVWTVEKSCTMRPLKSNILKRGTDAVMRPLKNRIAPVCHRVIGLPPPQLPTGTPNIEAMTDKLWPVLWAEKLKEKKGKKRKAKTDTTQEDDDDDEEEREGEGVDEGLEVEQEEVVEAVAMPNTFQGGPVFLTWQHCGPWSTGKYGGQKCLDLGGPAGGDPKQSRKHQRAREQTKAMGQDEAPQPRNPYQARPGAPQGQGTPSGPKKHKHGTPPTVDGDMAPDDEETIQAERIRQRDMDIQSQNLLKDFVSEVAWMREKERLKELYELEDDVPAKQAARLALRKHLATKPAPPQDGAPKGPSVTDPKVPGAAPTNGASSSSSGGAGTAPTPTPEPEHAYSTQAAAVEL